MKKIFPSYFNRQKVNISIEKDSTCQNKKIVIPTEKQPKDMNKKVKTKIL